MPLSRALHEWCYIHCATNGAALGCMMLLLHNELFSSSLFQASVKCCCPATLTQAKAQRNWRLYQRGKAKIYFPQSPCMHCFRVGVNCPVVPAYFACVCNKGRVVIWGRRETMGSQGSRGEGTGSIRNGNKYYQI